MDNRIEKIQELMKNASFIKKLLGMENPEDVQDLFEDNGVALTLDEVKQIGLMLDKVFSGEITAEQLEQAASGELSEDDLEQVAGGVILAGIATMIITGVFAAGAAYGSYKAVEVTVTNWDSITNFFKSW